MKIGLFIGDRGNWSFFKELYDDWRTRYQVNLFNKKVYRLPLLSGRLNRWSSKDGIKKTLNRSDVGFFEWASELLLPASHLPKSVPIVTRLHSYELYSWAPKVNWENVDKIILVSNAMKNKFSSLYPDTASKLEVVYYGKHLELFTPTYRPFQFDIGMLCRIDPVKRVYEMLMVMHELHLLGYRPHLHIGGGVSTVGESERYYNAILNLISKLSLDDYVTFYGHVADPHLWLRNIDIFISNSYWEGMQNALIEAMATSRYCLSHTWDGSEEVLPAENLCQTDNEMRDRIIAYAEMSDAEQRSRQEQMRTFAEEKFDYNNFATKLTNIVESVR